MCESNSTPCGLKSLMECISRATLLARPDDIPGFLSTYTQKMLESRDASSNNPSEAAFLYQEQWENSFLEEECEQTQIPKVSMHDLPSTASSISGEAFHKQEISVNLTAEEKLTSSKPTQGQHQQRRSSVTVPHDMKEKPSLPQPVLPPVPQRAPLKKRRGQVMTKACGNVYTCPLADCFHNDQKDRGQVDGSQSVGISTASETEINLGLQKPNVKPRSFKIPYKPKGGYIADPELMPKKCRTVVSDRQASTAQAVLLEDKICTNISQVPPETSVCTRLHMNHCVHIIRYKRIHAQCSTWQPHSAGWHNITLRHDNELQQARQQRKTSTVNLSGACFSQRNYSAL